MNLIRSKQRIDARFLEPACGSGNFLVQVLRRKLAAVERKFAKSDFERRHYALLALMCIYGIELLADNVAECRANVLETLAEYLGLDDSEDDLFLTVTGLTVTDVHLLVRLEVFNTGQMNQAVFAFRRCEGASPRYTGIPSHEGLLECGLYDTVVARE